MSPTEISEILDEINIRFDKIDDKEISVAFSALLQLIERLSQENEKLKADSQRLRDENNLLKGEHGKPRIRGNTNKGKDVSSEAERKEREKNKEKKSKAKKHKIKIDRTEICKVDRSELPEDVEFKGYENVVIQEIVIKTDNVEYKKEVFYSPSEKKTYVGKLPVGVTGEFGPGVRSLVCTLKHMANMSEPKILEFFQNFGIYISQSTISRILTKDQEGFHQEKADIFQSGLCSTIYQQIDDTGVRVNGENQYSQIVSNPYYTAYFTVPHKDRLTVIDILLGGVERAYCFNQEAFSLLEYFRVSKKLIALLKDAAEDKTISEEEMQILLNQLFPDPLKGKNTRARIMEAAAIASYHQQTEIPVIRVLLSDDAPQFKKITEEQGLCWVHDGRHYKKLDPVVSLNREQLEDFLTQYWDYYGELLAYKEHPTCDQAEELSAEFDELFSTKTGYYALDDRIEKTKAKIEELLKVLKYPELPLHNNDAELGARAEKRRQDVSLQTKTKEGTEAKDTFLTITQTAKKLGVSAYEYIYDRISKQFNMPSLSKMIEQRTLPQLE
jgi:regulator of replication initiation timing